MADQRFYVIGGEYSDTSFTSPAPGTELESHGPFSEREAKVFWQSVTGKTVDNAMVRYFLRPEDETNGKIYWVVGGEYADSAFTKLAATKELEVYGPFEKWEALGFWRGLTSKSVDDALVRYEIRKNYNPAEGDLKGSSWGKVAVRTKTKSVAIAAPPAKVFAFLADAKNWPQWAINNVKSVRPGSDGYWDLDTPRGAGRLKLDCDEKSGLLDHVFVDASGNTWTVPARVIPVGEGAVFIMTFLKPASTSESEFASGMGQIDEEMATLKRLLETR